MQGVETKWESLVGQARDWQSTRLQLKWMQKGVETKWESLVGRMQDWRGVAPSAAEEGVLGT